MLPFKLALVSTFLFRLRILLDGRYSQVTTLTNLLLANNAVVVSNTDPFCIYSIEYENVQNEESLVSSIRAKVQSES